MVFTSRPPDFLDTRLAVEGGERLSPRPPTEPLPPRQPEPIIGLVIFTTHRGERAEAILDRHGRWRCPKLPVLDRVLNILYEPRRVGQGGAPSGHEALGRVAAWLKGTVEVSSDGDDSR